MGELADNVRRLVELTVICDTPPGAAKAIADELGAVADRLARHVPDPPHARFLARPGDAGFDEATMHASMPYDVVIGRYNPLALPITIEARPPKVHGRGRFTKAYEGAPGWVHGAVIAGAFDIVLTAANRLDGAAGPTRRLSLHYLRPTLLAEESDLEAWVEHRTKTRVTSKGRLVQRGAVTVEAVGEFAVMDPARIGR
jgi:acyl-coenzyme A thioesterase PaaI-like protein